MHARPLIRATVAAVALALAFAGVAAADTAPGDADLTAPGPQTSRDLGTVVPGATVLADIGLIQTCRWPGHVDHGQRWASAIADAAPTVTLCHLDAHVPL